MRRSRSMPLLFILAVFAFVLISCTSENAGTTSESEGRSSSATEASAAAEPSSAAQDGAVERPAAEGANAAEVLDALYAEAGDSDEALKALENIGTDAMDDDARLVYAVLLRNEGRLDESRTELETLVAENPSDAAAWFNLALVEHGAGREAERDAALERALEADSAFAEAHALKGNLAIADSDWRGAERSLKKALEYQPETVESLVGLAWVYAKTDRVEEALPLLDEAVELEPDFAYARVDRSRVNVALRNYNDAEDDLDAVIGLEPDVPWHYLDRARIRLRYFKEYDGARADLERVEELDPGNFFALVYLAGLHDEERRFALSQDYYTRVVEARPDYVWAYMPLGKFAWMTGDFAAAANWFAKAAAEDPEEFSFSLMAALSLTRSGKKTEGDRILADTIRRYDRTETAYEVIRFCTERSSDFYAVNALNKEPNETLRERLWFYMGAIYEMEDNEIGSQSVFERLADRRGEMEYDLAYAALHGMDG